MWNTRTSRSKVGGLLALFVIFAGDTSYDTSAVNAGSRDQYSNITNGFAWYLNLTLSTKLFDLMVSYWNGDKYITNHGGDLYNSRSTTFKHPEYIEPDRELLILRLLQDIHIIDNLYVTARFEPYYNFVKNKFNFSHGLYVNYKHTFFVRNVKREHQNK